MTQKLEVQQSLQTLAALLIVQNKHSENKTLSHTHTHMHAHKNTGQSGSYMYVCRR